MSPCPVASLLCRRLDQRLGEPAAPGLGTGVDGRHLEAQWLTARIVIIVIVVRVTLCCYCFGYGLVGIACWARGIWQWADQRRRCDDLVAAVGLHGDERRC